MLWVLVTVNDVLISLLFRVTRARAVLKYGVCLLQDYRNNILYSDSPIYYL